MGSRKGTKRKVKSIRGGQVISQLTFTSSVYGFGFVCRTCRLLPPRQAEEGLGRPVQRRRYLVTRIVDVKLLMSCLLQRRVEEGDSERRGRGKQELMTVWFSLTTFQGQPGLHMGLSFSKNSRRSMGVSGRSYTSISPRSG